MSTLIVPLRRYPAPPLPALNTAAHDSAAAASSSGIAASPLRAPAGGVGGISEAERAAVLRLRGILQGVLAAEEPNP